MGRKYCMDCKQWVTPKEGANILIALILLLFGILPAIIYWVWASKGAGECPICGGENWGQPG